MAESKRPDAKGISYFDITDFSPGIFDNSLVAAGAAPNAVPGIFPAPPGAADATATFGCMSLPNGGLGPGPSLGGAPGSTGISLSDMGVGASAQPCDISSLINSQQSGGDELVVGYTFISPSTTQTTAFLSYLVSAATGTAIHSDAYTFTSNKNFIAYPFMTTINNGGTFQPVVILPVTAPDGPNSNLYVYPNLASPTTYTLSTITQHLIGNAVGHQGRVLVQQVNSSYSWPPVTRAPFPNEGFSYTDPPETTTWPQQFEIFGPENPFGYGAVNSVSAGELFCVKRRGGAIIIQGDLNNPTVTTLPGVQSTGFLYGHSDTDQNGMYYCSEVQGAWLWNGGNASTKISSQLDDNFFSVANPIADTAYYGYYCQRWGDWMLFSNNWIFNTTTGGWWRLADPSVHSFFWFVPAFSHRYMFAALPTVTATTENFLFEFDRVIPGASFSWQSLPIKLPSEDHTSTVRELVIRASNPYGDAAPQIIATLIDDKGTSTTLPTWTMTPGIDNIQEWRVNAGVKQTTTVAVNLACSGTLYAPVVAGLSMGSRSREHLGAH